MASISLENVSMVYNSNGNSTTALKDLNLRVEDGDFISLIGPSGCGKSTILDLFAGLKKPTIGKVVLDEEEITSPGPDRGVVFQDFSLFPWMNTFENVHFAIEHTNGKCSRSENFEKTQKYLELVGLANFGDKYPNTLSGGMRQRVAIARMLAIDPKVFLMDEPFGSLDSLNRAYMQDLLLYLWTQGDYRKTVLFVTHDVDEALLLSDKIAVMTPSPGRIKEIVKVPFARPRCRSGLSTDHEYISLRSRLLSLLYEEMLGTITQQEKEMRQLK